MSDPEWLDGARRAARLVVFTGLLGFGVAACANLRPSNERLCADGTVKASCADAGTGSKAQGSTGVSPISGATTAQSIVPVAAAGTMHGAWTLNMTVGAVTGQTVASSAHHRLVLGTRDSEGNP